jgi:hypothetical protein
MKTRTFRWTAVAVVALIVILLSVDWNWMQLSTTGHGPVRAH